LLTYLLYANKLLLDEMKISKKKSNESIAF